MHDARDVEDTRLLEEGEHELLLTGYLETIRQRCLVRLRGDRDAAAELAQLVCLRLWKELSAGRRYRVPFRVVVHKVVDFTADGFFAGAKPERELPEGWDAQGPDAYGEWEQRHDLAGLLSGLPERQREVAELRYLSGLEPAEIAAELGIEANAVHQALHNAHAKLREKIVA
jgi:RNA polymerase sigma-70 factor (ECF subfamily)